MKKILLFISSAFILGMNSVYAQPENASVSLGATLSEEQKSQTLNVLDANNVEEDKIHLIDGDKLNEYLNDGSDSSTNIYSSSKVEFRNTGYGVHVEILTPENILLVSESAYQNAAISAGASNVDIKIASVTEVTGEGALAGVYEIFYQEGVDLNPEDIGTAENQIKIEQLLAEETSLTDIEISSLITRFNLAVVIELESTETLTEEDIEGILSGILNEYNYDLTDNAINTLLEHGLVFSQSDVAKNPETRKNLEAALAGYEELKGVIGSNIELDSINIIINDYYLTENRYGAADEEYDNVFVIDYTIENTGSGDYPGGSEMRLFNNNKSTEHYFLPNVSTLNPPVPSGRSDEFGKAFGFDGEPSNLELEIQQFLGKDKEIIPLDNVTKR